MADNNQLPLPKQKLIQDPLGSYMDLMKQFSFDPTIKTYTPGGGMADQLPKAPEIAPIKNPAVPEEKPKRSIDWNQTALFAMSALQAFNQNQLPHQVIQPLPIQGADYGRGSQAIMANGGKIDPKEFEKKYAARAIVPNPYGVMDPNYKPYMDYVRLRNKQAKEASQEKQYTPSQGTRNLKAAYAVGSMIAPPVFVPLSVAGDAYTATRYAVDGQTENALGDVLQAGLSLIPGMKGIKPIRSLDRLVKSGKVSSDIKTVGEAFKEGGRIKATDGLTLDGGDPPTGKKPFDWAGEMRQLSTHKLDGTSPLTVAQHAAQAAGISSSLLYSSAYVEGLNQQLAGGNFISGAYSNAQKGYYTDKTGKKRLGTQSAIDNTAYPVDGFGAYGLDTFSDRYEEFVKKGYLPQDFKNNFIPYTATNEQGAQVHTAAFKNNEAALTAKAAYLRSNQDDVVNYFKKKNVQLDPQAQSYFTMALYNSSPRTAYKMMDEYVAAKDKNAYITKGQTKYKQVHNNIYPRLGLMPVAEELMGQPTMKMGGKMKGKKCADGGVIPYYPEGTSHDLDPETIKQLLASGYELDFE